MVAISGGGKLEREISELRENEGKAAEAGSVDKPSGRRRRRHFSLASGSQLDIHVSNKKG